MLANQPISFEGVHRFLKTRFGEDLHAKRILSLAGATLGAIAFASLAVALIGQGLALARGLLPKYAIKQVDRMLSNQGIDVDALLVHWVPYVVGKGQHHGGDGLDRVRRRRPGDDHAVAAHPPRPGDAAGVADR